MDPSYEDLALLRAHEPGLKPPSHHHDLRREHPVRHQVARTLRRVADRLEG